MRLTFRAADASNNAPALLEAVAREHEAIRAGKNSRVVKLRFADGSYAVKLYPNDGRRRLDHEWRVVSTLTKAGFSVSPKAVSRGSDDGVEWAIYEWVPGRRLPGTLVGAAQIIKFLSALHQMTPPTGLPQSLLNEVTALRGKYGIGAQIGHLHAHRSPDAVSFRQYFAALLGQHSAWNGTQVICHTDSNPANFLISTVGSIRGVDWDAGGLGDPLFELGALSVHPALPLLDVDGFVALLEANYHRSMRQEDLRALTYYRTVMALWWACRLSRQRIETPEQFTKRDAARVIEYVAIVEALT